MIFFLVAYYASFIWIVFCAYVLPYDVVFFDTYLTIAFMWLLTGLLALLRAFGPFRGVGRQSVPRRA